MPKRKHSEIEDKIEKISDRAIRAKASRLQAKIVSGTKSLKDALNLARGFERQKMGRRQKKASSEPHTLLRLREEAIVLKELDLPKTAGDYLLKQMVKTKRIRESEAFVALFGEDPKVEGPGSSAIANVLGRLFKARPVLDVLPGIMDGIRQVLALDSAKASQSKPETGRITNVRAEEKQEPFDDGVDAEDEFEGFSDEGLLTEKNDHSQSGGESDDADLQAFDDWVAGSSDEEHGDEDAEADLDPMEIPDEEGQDHDREASVSVSGSETPEGEQPLSKKPLPTPPNKISSTSFLPSLSMGGYYSGSESDDFDDQDRNRGPAVPKDRKNRRGQRARQKIAEKKFGGEANHLQKQQQESKDDRNSGWDAKRGAVEGNAYDPRQRRLGKGGFARSKGPTGANGEAVTGNRTIRASKSMAKKNDGPIHPSWEAAKKRKQETGRAAFAGKKITFD